MTLTRYLKPQVAENEYGLPPKTLYGACARGELAFVRYGRRGILIERAELERWLADQTVPARRGA